MKDQKEAIRRQSFGEELANSIVHGVAAVLAVIAIPLLVVSAVQKGGAAKIVSASIFGTSLFLLYLASSICHALKPGRAKRIFEILDHCAIYILIAGTYTPFLMVSLGGAWGWSLFGVIWGLAVLGILFKSIFGIKYPMASNLLYLVMGWIVVIAIKPMIAAVPQAGLMWLLAGGLFYTFGIVFFVLDSRWKFAHFIWHVFVVIGSACHFVAIYSYVK
jgi:hemolysin III